MRNSEPIERLIASFRNLPGVGYKTAERYAYYVIGAEIAEVEELAKNILSAKTEVKFCKECGGYTNKDVCQICSSRSGETICVVAEPKDISVMEKVKNYNGLYHVLGGTLSPLENRGPDDLRIKELLSRIQKLGTKEIIMATNPDVEGDATAMYIARLLSPLGIKVTRIAQGISMGTDLEYADEVTLSKALEARQVISNG